MRTFMQKWLERRASIRVLLLQPKSFLRDSRKIHVDAFRDWFVVVLGGKHNAKLLYMMIIYPVIHSMIGSSAECSGDFVLPKYS